MKRSFHPQYSLLLSLILSGGIGLCSPLATGAAEEALPEGYVRLSQPSLRGEAPGMSGIPFTATGRIMRVSARPGDEIVSGLLEFATANGFTSAYIMGIGGFASAEFGWYDPEAGGMKRIDLDQKLEVNSFTGSLTPGEDGDVRIHVHAIVSDGEGIAHGGHLFSARVNPTMEIYLVETAPGEAPEPAHAGEP